MKVNINDMTARERIVLTKEQLVSFVNGCDVEVSGAESNWFSVGIDMPPVIEVEEVLGE